MAQSKFYSILDGKTALYSAPFLQPNNATAIRTFQRMLKNEESTMNQFPEDYNLMVLGEFDDLTGILSPASAPSVVMSAVDAKGL